MTTIATDGKSMAADGQSQCRGTIINKARAKIRRLSDGRVVGSAGDMHDGTAWADWLEGDKSGDCPIVSEDFGGIILCMDGTAFGVDHKGRECPVELPYATGSGMDLAMGAMDAGASPEQAVKIAVARDPGSGGLITVEHLKQTLKEVA